MVPPDVQPVRERRPLLRIARGALLVVFVNPYALMAAAVAAWLITHLILAVVKSPHGHEEWSLTALVHCYACIAALVIIAALAVCHVIVTFVAGMKKD